jgi:hypothetical protein
MPSTTARRAVVLVLAAVATLTVGCSRIENTDAADRKDSVAGPADAGRAQAVTGEQRPGKPRPRDPAEVVPGGAGEQGDRTKVAGVPVSADRALAAEFVGIPPDAIREMGRGPRLEALPGGVRRLSAWRFTGVHPVTQTPAEVDVRVDLDLLYVTRATWHGNARPAQGDERPAPTGAVSRERARSAAREFLAATCWFLAADDNLAYESSRGEGDDQRYSFRWDGDGPGEFTHRVLVNVRARTGKVVSYSATIDPRDPSPTAAIKLTEQDAAARARAAVPALCPEATPEPQVEVYKLWTRSPYAPVGRPVYMVNLVTEIARQGAPGPVAVRTGCGVDAETGEVLTKVIFGPGEVYRGTASVTISREQALVVVRAALPKELLDPTVEVLDPQIPNRLAPADRTVYPVRIQGLLQPSDQAADATNWMQTWAVDAVSGKLYGLPLRTRER